MELDLKRVPTRMSLLLQHAEELTGNINKIININAEIKPLK
jgi:hypothetical protein